MSSHPSRTSSPRRLTRRVLPFVAAAAAVAIGARPHDPLAASPGLRYTMEMTTVDATDTFSWTVTNTNQDPTFDQDLLDRTDAEGDVISLSAGATDPFTALRILR